jgi:serine-type D-Ala-D-Ala carboxypeptidase
MKSTQLQLNELLPIEFPLTCKTLDSGLTENVSPGFVAGIWQKKTPDEIWVRAVGSRRILPSTRPMFADTVFDLASVTKVYATATLSAVLVDRGWLSWDTSLKSLLPLFQYPEIKIRHLLSHTAGFSAWEPLWEKVRDHFAPAPLYSIPIKERQAIMRQIVFSIPPVALPGVQTLYSDISFLLLGFGLEEVTQMPLDQAVQKMVWEPMGIQETYFHHIHKAPEEDAQENIAATEKSDWRGAILQGQVHDDNCWSMGGYGGHAGAFGTARDLLHFSRALFQGFLSQSVLKAAWSRVAEPLGCVRTLGWDTPSGESPAAGHRFSALSIGHLGFTGTSLWIDPQAEIAVVLLSNRVHPSCENIKIRSFRPRFHDAVRLDLRR